MRAMLCGCGLRLQAVGYERLVGKVLDHLSEDHPEIKLGKAQVRVVREMVVCSSYRFASVASDSSHKR
jgi:hypothetical protein